MRVFRLFFFSSYNLFFYKSWNLVFSHVHLSIVKDASEAFYFVSNLCPNWKFSKNLFAKTVRKDTYEMHVFGLLSPFFRKKFMQICFIVACFFYLIKINRELHVMLLLQGYVNKHFRHCGGFFFCFYVYTKDILFKILISLFSKSYFALIYFCN